jgi:MFS transporter, SET family, sugar efflux transporter
MSPYSIILRNPAIRAATIALMCHGITVAALIPFQSVIGIDHFGMSNAGYSVFMFAAALLNVIAALLLGVFSDSLKDRRALIIFLACCGVAGYGIV